ncbi:MAG: DEAD/DEAH box helicase family protein, partial [Moorellales bacterium]
CIEYTTASERLAREVQVLLLALGIASYRKVRAVGGKPYWRLFISGSSLREFQRRVGFLLPEKQRALNEIATKPVNDNRDLAVGTAELLSAVHKAYMKKFGTYPPGYRKSWEAYRAGRRTPSWHKLRRFLEAYASVGFLDEYQELKKRADRGLLFDTVETRQEGRCPVYDLVVPQSHAFWAGGFINHNTVIFASVARELARPTLVLAHRDELVRQAADKFEMVWPEASLGIVKAEENDHAGKDVVIASVQTISRPNRLAQFGPERFGLLVVDEAHHAVARSYMTVFERLGFMSGAPDKLLLGVTATPMRGDRVGLGAVFEKIVFQRSILWMIRAGYLVDFRGLAVDTGVDLGDVRVVAGDFADADLEDVLNTVDRNGLIVRAYLDHTADRRAVAFTSGVQHALDLAATFRAAGVAAEAISGETPEEERRRLLAAFRAGEIRVLANCFVLTEGWDEPSLDCILMARPTKSKALYMQMLGRGARPYPGKQDCLVIDFVDNTGRHDVMTLPTLFGLSCEELKDSGLLRAALLRRRREALRLGPGTASAVLPAGAAVAREVEILGRSAFRWTVVGDLMRLPVGPKAYIYLVPLEDRRDMYYVEYAPAEEDRVRLSSRPLDIGYAQGLAEEYLRRLGKAAAAFAAKDAAWREQPPTDKQVDLLLRLGLWREGMTRGEAADTLEVFFAAREARKKGRAFGAHRTG